MKKILCLVLATLLTFVALTGCVGVRYSTEERAKLNEAKEIAAQLIEDKYGISATVVGGNLIREAYFSWFSVTRTVTDSAHIQMRYDGETFDVLLMNISDAARIKIYDNRQFGEITDYIKPHFEDLFRLDYYTFEIRFGVEASIHDTRRIGSGDLPNGLISEIFTGYNLDDILGESLQIVVKTYGNSYLHEITEQELAPIHHMFENTQFGVSVLNHRSRQSIEKTDFHISQARIDMWHMEHRLGEKSIYVASAIVMGGGSFYWTEDDERQSIFGSFLFDINEYNGIKYVSTNENLTIDLKTSNETIDPANFDGRGTINARILSEIYCVTIEYSENREGRAYIFFPVSSVRNRVWHRRINSGVVYERDGERRYKARGLEFERIGDYYRISGGSLPFLGEQYDDNFKLVILGSR